MSGHKLFETGQVYGAKFSLCRTYRYQLWRQWDDTLPTVLFVGLNPSTADETVDDPTIRKCVKFAKRWGFGTYLMCNLYAFRSTDPKGLATVADPVGLDNDAFIANAAGRADLIIAAWGADKSVRHRDKIVLPILGKVSCLKVSKEGYPWHPLYMRDATDPIDYFNSKPA